MEMSKVYDVHRQHRLFYTHTASSHWSTGYNPPRYHPPPSTNVVLSQLTFAPLVSSITAYTPTLHLRLTFEVGGPRLRGDQQTCHASTLSRLGDDQRLAHLLHG